MTMKQKKNIIIDRVISRIEALSKNESLRGHALEENRKFFEAVRSLPLYLLWLALGTPTLEKNRVPSFSELDPEGWGKDFQEELLHFERSRFPSILTPLCSEIIKMIHRIPDTGGRPMILASIGCGPMELERRILKALLKGKIRHPVVIFGIDASEHAINAAYENLSKCRIPTMEVPEVTADFVKDFLFTGNERHRVVLCKRDVLEISNCFPPGGIDLAYHRNLKHRLPEIRANALDNMLEEASSRSIEAGEYRGWYLLFLSAWLGWRFPILANDLVFTNLRSPKKSELRKTERKSGTRIKIIPGGGYIKVRDMRYQPI